MTHLFVQLAGADFARSVIGTQRPTENKSTFQEIFFDINGLFYVDPYSTGEKAVKRHYRFCESYVAT